MFARYDFVVAMLTGSFLASIERGGRIGESLGGETSVDENGRATREDGIFAVQDEVVIHAVCRQQVVADNAGSLFCSEGLFRKGAGNNTVEWDDFKMVVNDKYVGLVISRC